MEFKLINYCEIDAQASKSYSVIHNVDESLNLGDICGVDIESLPTNITLITHGSPCTSFSQAGLQLGGDRGSGTPSSLMWNSVEIIKHCKPKFVIWENVANVLSPKHKHNFDEYISELDSLWKDEQCDGYKSYYAVLNAKEFNTPQNRSRIFVVSIRKDIDKHSGMDFIFPNPIEMTVTLRDVLEKDSDRFKYLTEAQINRIHTTTYASGRRRIQYKDWCDTLCARDGKDPKCVEDEKGIRHLTTKEYWRIMGFSDEDYQKAEDLGLSNFALYKQAGNSIALNVITEILRNIKNQYGEAFSKDCSYLSLFSGVGAFEMALKKI